MTNQKSPQDHLADRLLRLARRGDIQAVPALIKLLCCDTSQQFAKQALVKLGPKGADILIGLLQDKDAYFRKPVMEFLAEIGDPRVVEQFLQETQSPSSAFWALQRLEEVLKKSAEKIPTYLLQAILELGTVVFVNHRLYDDLQPEIGETQAGYLKTMARDELKRRYVL